MTMPTRYTHLFYSAVAGVLLLVLVLHGLDLLAPDLGPHVQAQGELDAAAQPLEPAILSTGGYTVHLPLVARGWPPVPSPFTIQIADLAEMTGPYSGTLVTRLAESGAAWARVRVDWAIIERDAPTGYSWDYHDRNLTQVASAGVKLIATIAGTPSWAGYYSESDPNVTWDEGDPCAPIAPERLVDFGQSLTMIVNRYQQPPWNIHHWELFNEPDITEPSFGQSCYGNYGGMYADMLEVAYTAVKAADPTATVLMGGLAYDWFTPYGPFNRYFVDDVMASGGDSFVDALSLHYFPDFSAEWERFVAKDPEYGEFVATCGDPTDKVGIEYDGSGIDLVAKSKHFQNRMDVCQGVKKPLWVTELAEHGDISDPANLAQQARYVIQGNARGLAAGAVNITWFALVTPPYDDNDQGLLYQDDKSPKPAYVVYQTMASELSGYEYAATTVVPAPGEQGEEAYVFRTPSGKEKTVAWFVGPEELGESGSLTFQAAAGLRVVDRYGDETLINDGGPGDLDGVQNGVITIEVTIEPVFVSAN